MISEGEAFAAAAREFAFVAATRNNDDVLADRFAVLSRTCVSCHGGYLHGPRKRGLVDFESIKREPQPVDEQPNNQSSRATQPPSR